MKLTIVFSLIFGVTLSAVAALPPVPASLGNDEYPVFAPQPQHNAKSRKFTGIPSLAVAANGRMWATWYCGPTAGEDKNNYVVLATSDDGGANWKECLIADPDGSGPRRAFDPELWIAPDGLLRWSWTDRSTAEKPDYKTDRLWMAELEANSVPAKPPKCRCIGEGVMMCKPIVLSNGEWMFPVSKWRDEKSARFLVSKDGGASFSERGGISLPQKERLFDEHTLVEKKNGELWCLIRTGSGIWESFSRDYGKSWSKPAPSRFAHPSARCFFTRLKSGNLLLVKHGELDKKIKRSHLTAFLSTDDGESWSGGLLLDERFEISYPDGQQTEDGTIFVVYDYNRRKEQHILFCAFTEEDLIAGRFCSEKAKQRKRVNR